MRSKISKMGLNKKYLKGAILIRRGDKLVMDKMRSKGDIQSTAESASLWWILKVIHGAKAGGFLTRKLRRPLHL